MTGASRGERLWVGMKRPSPLLPPAAWPGSPQAADGTVHGQGAGTPAGKHPVTHSTGSPVRSFADVLIV